MRIRHGLPFAALALAACTADGASTTTRTAEARPAAEAARETLTVDVDDRKVEMLVVRPANVRGVAVFGHGYGGAPANYPKLMAALAEHGWMVVAPLHVDSMRHRERTKYDQRGAFMTRVADQAAAAGLAGRLAPGQPLVAIGHSFGALLAAIQGGALGNVVPARNPDVRAVLMLSSPGRLPGLSEKANFASLAAPLMLVTGDKDIVPGFITDPAQHLLAYEGSTREDAIALVVRNGSHNIAERDSGAGRDRAMTATLDFLDAYGRGDAAARRRLAALRSDSALEVRRR